MNVPIENMNEKSFQICVIQQSFRMGGFGIRDKRFLSHVAYLGGIEKAFSSLLGDDGIGQQLVSVIGDIDSLTPENRWEALANSGSRTGEEMKESWNSIKHEALESINYLGLDLDGHSTFKK